jgi:hypothetical protein
MVFSRVPCHIAHVKLRMKTTALLALGAAVLVSGCATTDDAEPTVKVDPNARWIVISTNDPVSSPLMEKGDDSIMPPRPESVLLAADSQDARQEIENSGISPALKKKMLDGDVLTVADIEDLGRYKVNEATVLKYVRSTPVVYILTTDDINRLQQAGVGKGVTDHMLATVKDRPVRVVHRYYGYYGYPYYPYAYHYDPWYSSFYNYHYYPYYYGHHHHHHGHHHGGGIRVYRPR